MIEVLIKYQMKIYKLIVLKSALKKIVLAVVLSLTAIACSKKIDMVDPTEQKNTTDITTPFGLLKPTLKFIVY